ncbi:ABCG-like transporter [Ordospora colligata]|uniref:ABCG-like transporter n=1 Tax=Ordospora colligata OC4 TaxID=1354746 RepID=A0A0B2UMF1_9MICR|nr:ABCG-like transporter [Ordospora colligata OC4]KHN70145.1 ABCG-like transporter [Ordospora colligata OC4]TBU16527.1 ABCG-like transporter [Ordospora colligata]TBU16568.1 ABCG-like transporter [Ordospora colligata]TBU19141.1 ABCG-like transporter [Ordospora colligata]
MSHSLKKLGSKDSELVWKGLSLRVNGADGSKKMLLNNVSGSVEPQTMTGLMGPSGAGKTTLMNSLAGRFLPNMNLSGTILLNSQLRSEETWPRVIGYVEQDFYAYQHQTVFETLLFASKIKMGVKEVDKKMIDRIDEVLALLGLKNARNTYIRSLSGGEKKRVSIGVELLGDPSIIFCDEPTSGLDSFNAVNILSLLKDLAKMGKTILVTIHQPSYEMIDFFDKIILMSMGNLVYDGDLKGCVDFFDACGYSLPKQTNPVDFFLNTVSFDSRSTAGEERSLQTITHISQEWKKIKKEPIPKYHGKVGSGYVPIKTSQSFFLLMSRNLIDYTRNVDYLKIKVFQKIFFIVVFGLAYLQIGYSIESIYTRLGGITFMLTNALFGVCGPIFNVFSMEKRVISRERKSGMYSGIVAFLAKYMSEIVLNFMFEIPYITAVYWMIGLNNNAGRFFIFLVIVLSLTLFSISYGLAISAMASSQNVAQVLGSLGLLVFLIYSGSFNNPNTIPAWLRWMVWLSPMYYATKASFQNQLNGVVFTGLGGIKVSGESQIDLRGLGGTGIWTCIFVLWGISLFWTVVGSIALHYGTRNNMKVKIDEEPNNEV